ncbi:hypothetical lipoprotein [Metamycoplasma arthritidis]|uniref:Hypothetical lipoprotein n=1 Tax=Metamycoplasma arthritidis (strain 158L3-1) TaxID=243272 RepID=B3PMR4_META1|nr:hypothetical protein [Metamycoplasma arthritidis]ACF07316.1 hypothetical lipoprotein [Metamycoplasma arthritidis 158L3-1]VEU78839.1 hypothetical lipoprotein [Metamycoplasma arthritidis]
MRKSKKTLNLIMASTLGTTLFATSVVAASCQKTEKSNLKPKFQEKSESKPETPKQDSQSKQTRPDNNSNNEENTVPQDQNPQNPPAPDLNDKNHEKSPENPQVPIPNEDLDKNEDLDNNKEDTKPKINRKSITEEEKEKNRAFLKTTQEKANEFSKRIEEYRKNSNKSEKEESIKSLLFQIVEEYNKVNDAYKEFTSKYYDESLEDEFFSLLLKLDFQIKWVQSIINKDDDEEDTFLKKNN